MADQEKNNTKYQQLFNDVKEYVSLQSDLLQVTMIEKTTKLLAKLITVVVTLILLLMFMFYILGAVAILLEPILGLAGSFAVISSLFLIVLAIVFIFRKKLIVKPLMYLLIDVFKENDKDEGDKNNEEVGSNL